MITKELISKSIDYIMQHLDEDISIEDVADYCHFSKFHFCRLFKAETGESIYAFIKRIKLEQSAFNIKIEKKRSITDIGYEYGYSPSNYSSVFKKQKDISPTEFRKNMDKISVLHPFYQHEPVGFKCFEEYNLMTQIKEFDDFIVIYERYVGIYTDLGKNWRAFLDKYKDYMREDTLLIEKSFADPAVADVDRCVYDICMTVNENICLDNITAIKGGKFAVYPYEGLVQDIYSAFQGLFNVWLANSSYKMDERYAISIYKSIEWDTLHVSMDLCIPVK